MAFIAMVFASIFILLLIALVFLTLIFLILAIVFKVIGKAKGNRKLKTAGNVFLVLGTVFAAPLIALTVYAVFNVSYTEVTLPDGETKYVSAQHISEMEAYLDDPDESSVKALEKLLDKDSDLVFYHDINHKSILDKSLEAGNADIVRIALEHGAVFDNPIRYERFSKTTYWNSSMDFYLDYENYYKRSITEDDIEILELMFENNASTQIKQESLREYSNAFGKAVWTVIYNDKAITDIELEFIQVLVDNGIASDPEFVLADEVKVFSYADKSYVDIVKDSNYDKLMELLDR